MNPVWHFVSGIAHVSAWVVGGARVGGVLTTNTTQAGTTAVTTEEELWTYSLPANTLNANGKAVKITAYGTCAANGNTKNMRVYFGSTAGVLLTGAFNGSSWKIVVIVTRTGETAQLLSGAGQAGGTANTNVTTASQTLSGAVAIAMKGTNGTAAADDIVFRGATVEVLN